MSILVFFAVNFLGKPQVAESALEPLDHKMDRVEVPPGSVTRRVCFKASLKQASKFPGLFEVDERPLLYLVII